MKCPFCPSMKRKVVDCRRKSEIVYRRSECLQCKRRYSTHEVLHDYGRIPVNKFFKVEPHKKQVIRSKPIAKEKPIKKPRRYIDENAGYNEINEIMKEIRGY